MLSPNPLCSEGWGSGGVSKHCGDIESSDAKLMTKRQIREANVPGEKNIFTIDTTMQDSRIAFSLYFIRMSDPTYARTHGQTHTHTRKSLA